MTDNRFHVTPLNDRERRIIQRLTETERAYLCGRLAASSDPDSAMTRGPIFERMLNIIEQRERGT